MGYTPHVLVVGGTATGAGVARDLAMRGLEVTLLVRGTLAGPGANLAEGLLDSGARVAATDPEAAARWYAESQRLREIAGHCVEETGGLVTALPGDEAALEGIREGCLRADVPVERLDGATIREREPAVSTDVTAGLAVPDARVDPFRLVLATAADAREYGATVETHTALTDLFVDDGAVTHATLRDRGADGTEMRRFDYVVNAAGPRAGRVAGLAGVELDAEFGTRPAVATADRPTERAVTRPVPGPRVVPFGGRCVLGGREGGDRSAGTVDDLLDEAGALVPAVGTARVLRGWQVARASPRQSGPRVRTLDHETRDGLWGLSTVVGATLTTHRLAAKAVADQVCRKFGITRECLTATHSLPAPTRDAETLAVEHGVDPNPVVCACESVTRAEVQDALDRAGEDADIEAVRVRTRAGMGECQGGQCAHRLAAHLHPVRDPEAVEDRLVPFVEGRWAGQRHALWGDQLAAAARTYRLHAGTLRLQPGEESGSVDLGAFEGGSGEDADDGPQGPRGPIP